MAEKIDPAELDSGVWHDCWQCAGEGVTFSCFDGFCEDAEEGCDDCAQRCDICRGNGGWHATIGEAEDGP